MPAPPRLRPTLQRRAVSAMTTRLPLKFAALGVAGVLWGIVSIEEPTVERVDVSLQPVPADTMTVVRRPLPRVQALVVGRNRDLFRLGAQPPVIRVAVPANAPETLTVRLTPEMVDLPVDITARVRDVVPSSVTLQIDALVERNVPVVSALTFEVDSGATISGPIAIAPDSVRILGSRTAVDRVDSISTQRLILRVRDTTAQSVALDTARLGVRVRPTRVQVRVPVGRLPAAPQDSSADTLPR